MAVDNQMLVLQLLQLRNHLIPLTHRDQHCSIDRGGLCFVRFSAIQQGTIRLSGLLHRVDFLNGDFDRFHKFGFIQGWVVEIQGWVVESC